MDHETNKDIPQAEPLSEIVRVCEAQRRFFKEGETTSHNFRIGQLKQLRKLITENEQEILAALKADLQKPAYEAYASEVGFLIQEINHALKNLRSWMKPNRVNTGVLSMPSRSRVIPEPKGVCLIIAPWNYPFQLVLAPAVAALAAGNTVILKPAEQTPVTANLLARLMGEYFKPEVVKVTLGDGAQVIPTLMEEFRFDHVFFTGSPAVGRKVAQQAAEKLVPVTLELGGKNPCVVDGSASLKVAARRILFGKFLNAGQTCIAPDYLLVHQDIAEKFTERLKQTLDEFYPHGALRDENYSGIVDTRHFDRMLQYLQDGDIIYGGEYNREELRMAPVLLRPYSLDTGLMKNEIFGPILPVLTYRSLEEAREIILRNPQPLSLYYFGKDQKNESFFTRSIQAGGVAVNNTVIHFVNSELPFGGIGGSGYGSYHGHWGFRNFSHFKAVLRSANWLDPVLKYPPYPKILLKAVKALMR